jgi:diguanylate cyclase (GGDEF)-like protein/PAS domain S-box-containing protein
LDFVAHVLLVEDSPGDASLVRSMLGDAGATLDVRWVRSLAEAGEALSEGAPSLVLVDLGLPDATGLEALDALLRATPADVPVVVLTGDADETVGPTAIARGAHDFLRKSDLDSASLARCVRYALSSQSTAAALRLVEGPLRGLFGSAVALAFIAADGTILEVNAGFEHLVGHGRRDVVGTTLADLAVPRERDRMNAALTPPSAAVQHPVEGVLRRADGGEAVVRFSAVPAGTQEAARACWAVLFQDLTEQRRAEGAARARSRLLDAVGEAVVAVDAGWRLTYLNAAAERLFQVVAEQSVGRPFDVLVRSSEIARLPATGLAEHQPPLRLATALDGPDGSVEVHLTVTPTPDDAGLIDGWIAVFVDVTERRGMQRQLAYQALHDGLTGLANRTLLMERLEAALRHREAGAGGLALLFLDLDEFKAINDTYGHDVGDAVLQAVANVLVWTVRPGDLVARLGGDEFVICCDDLADPDDGPRVAERITAALRRPLAVAGREILVSASIGLAEVAPEASPLPQGATLLTQADAALQQAKHRGRRRTEVFDDALRASLDRRVRLRRDLLAAPEEQLAVHFQPQVRLSTGTLIGFEALLRWHHPDLGAISPVEFIPIAEETGFILPLGRLVLERSVAQLGRWRSTRPEAGLTMSVNLSARQLGDATLVSFVADLLEREGVDPGALCLEITESVLMEDAQASVRRLRELKTVGVKLAVDDFGTGYSSLAYLRRFPIDWLKIDREFVRNLGASPEDAMIVASVTRLGASLHLEVLAEGVETEEHRDELARLGCDHGQGFLWSRPMAAEDLDELVSRAPAAWEPASARSEPMEDPGASPVSLSTDEVVSVLRHELANPVTVIQAYTELLREGGHGTDERLFEEAVQAIDRSTDAIQELLGALNDLRGLGNGTLRLERERVDIAELIRETMVDLVHLLGGHDARMVVDAGSDPSAAVDAARIRQVLVNLLTNAVRYTPPGTAIEVEVSTLGEYLQVVVADDGPGIPADKVGMLFRKFSRLERWGDGTGLGLFLSRGLARAHGGDLRYAVGPRGGSRFVLTLPRAAALVPTTETAR